jgi:hypothetical protein
VELYSGHLYLHLALGTGHVKIRVSHRRIDDGQWHTFHMERTKQWGKVGTLCRRMMQEKLRK